MTPRPDRPTSVLSIALLLGACGGGDGDPDRGGIGALPTPAAPVGGAALDGAPEGAPDAVAFEARDASLRFVIDGACGAVGEEIRLSVFLDEARSIAEEEADAPEVAAAAGDAQEELDIGTNVTAYTSFAQGLGDSIELVSRTDDAIRFRLGRADLVALTGTLGDNTLTNYFGAWPADAPPASALRKEAPSGCLWSLRLPPLDGSPRFCGSAYSRGAAGLLGQDVRRLEVEGCDAANPSGIPVIGLDGVGAAPR